MHVDGNGGEGGEPQRCYAAWCRPSLRPLRTACAPLLAALRVELRGSTAATTTTTSSSSSGAQNGHGAPTTGGFHTHAWRGALPALPAHAVVR